WKWWKWWAVAHPTTHPTVLSDLRPIASLLRFSGRMGGRADSFAAGVGGGVERDGGSGGKTGRNKKRAPNKKCRLKQVQTAFCFLYRI
ncbi:hypothetical protein, partial [Neisseria cinerea]|uniref:hypothetical protein n=1 Tax=Neisseria cinerea TaxID=483 RepID=UPI0028D4C769